jgi:hypothetical protein
VTQHQKIPQNKFTDSLLHCQIVFWSPSGETSGGWPKTAAAHKPSDRAWKQQKPRSKRQKEDISLSIPRCLPMSTRQSSIDAGINQSGPDLDLGERKGF